MLKPGVDAVGIAAVVVAAILEVLDQPELGVADVRDGAELVADLGLKSMDLAQLVAILEVELGADPFREAVSITSVRTVGDVCRAYEALLSGDVADSGAADLERARARGAARRGRG